MKICQKILTAFAVGFAVLAVLALPHASIAEADSYGLKATADAASIPTTKNVQTIIGNVIGTALSMISVLFFALMLYAGIKWMLARGDSEEARKALDTIIAAIIGMLVVLGSYAITNFVFNSFGQGGGEGGAAPKADSSPTGGGTDKTAWNDTDAAERCTNHYSKYGLKCQAKGNCNSGDGQIKEIKDAYSKEGFGQLGNGNGQDKVGSYIANACSGSLVCCL